jgi:prolyl 3-hydroxylase /prolyl 3,4-dihydroxylase
MEKLPFPHLIIDSFLLDEDVARAREVYSTTGFRPQHSDLFKFLQTGELASDPRLAFLKERLHEVFGRMTDADGWITIFASYYSRGDYLLCHDDRTESRQYAFSYYLEDYDTGKLLLYESDCMSVSKEIGIRANRLVVFEVSEKSYHEVAYCEGDGRKAFTGWFNVGTVIHCEQDTGEELLHSCVGMDEFPLELSFASDKLFFYPDIEYEFEYVGKAVEGPFYARRVERLELVNPLVPRIDGWETVDANFYHFRPGDYILLNDKSNDIRGRLCDIFIVQAEGAVEGEHGVFENTSHSIRYVDEKGEIAAELPIRGRSMFAVERGHLKYFVGRSTEEFFLAHFVLKLQEH